jgi:predicted Zn-ribbon and HTH transcriptional regulator/RNase adaptor protein for sRNA GlmZ degradation
MGQLIEYIKQRVYKENKNFLCCIVGQTGSGKSYASVSLAEQLDPTFNSDRIVYDFQQFMKVIETAKKGQAIVFDEAGISISSRSWYSILNKLINYVLQTFRHKNLIVFFTVPDFSFIDAQTRKLIHCLMEVERIDRKRNSCIIRPLFIQNNSRSGKLYFKYLRAIVESKLVKIRKIAVKKPSKELLKEYEKSKDKFTKKLNKEITLDFKAEKKKLVKKKLTCKHCNYQWKPYNYKKKPQVCPECRTRKWNKDPE